MSSPHLKAVIFDIGGVVVKSPLVAIAAYEHDHGLPKDFLNVSITQRGDGGAWQRFERGELSLFQFYREFSKDLSDVENGCRWYRGYCAARKKDCPPLPEILNIDGRELFGRMMRESAEADEVVIEAIRRIRKHGRHRLIALTNNFRREMSTLRGPEKTEGNTADADLIAEMEYLGWHGPASVARHAAIEALFDDFVGSSEAGMRKPEHIFYLYACRRNGIEPEQAVFLDDIGHNLRAANELGMETIQVKVGRSRESLEKLGEKLGIGLVDKGKL